jgi:hypothetical protein
VRTALCRKGHGETVPIHTANATSVLENVSSEQDKKPVIVESREPSRAEKRAALTLSAGEVFNPFNLFDGALIPAQVLRYSEITPSEKLVFARLLQFAGARGHAWPSLELLAAEVSLSVVQARRCVRALETRKLVRRVARSGRSNEFEFLWHPIYQQEHRQRRSQVIAPPQSSMIAPPRSQMTDAPQSPKIGLGRSSMAARRESIQSIKKEENHCKENQGGQRPQEGEQSPVRENTTAGSTNRRLEQTRQRDSLPDLEAEFRNRLKARHGDLVDAAGVTHCVLQELRWDFTQLESFLDFEAKQTTDPQRLRNPPGHYRRVAQLFQQAAASRREYASKQKQLRLERQLREQHSRAAEPKRTCPLSRCNGTGEYWNELGFVEVCPCEQGQKLSPKVLEAFGQVNAIRKSQVELNREG